MTVDLVLTLRTSLKSSPTDPRLLLVNMEYPTTAQVTYSCHHHVTTSCVLTMALPPAMSHMTLWMLTAFGGNRSLLRAVAPASVSALHTHSWPSTAPVCQAVRQLGAQCTWLYQLSKANLGSLFDTNRNKRLLVAADPSLILAIGTLLPKSSQTLPRNPQPHQTLLGSLGLPAYYP